jgi:hypothetical protein
VVDGGAQTLWSIGVIYICEGIPNLVETATFSLYKCYLHFGNTLPYSLVVLICPNILKVNLEIEGS